MTAYIDKRGTGDAQEGSELRGDASTDDSFRIYQGKCNATATYASQSAILCAGGLCVVRPSRLISVDIGCLYVLALMRAESLNPSPLPPRECNFSDVGKSS